MGLLNMARAASVWRGYEYYKGNKVCSFNQISENEYEGEVYGSSKEPYSVHIDTLHPKKSVCNCPFAEGNRKVCKHKTALYFAAFPKEAEQYFREVEEAEIEAEEFEEDIYGLVEEKIYRIKKGGNFPPFSVDSRQLTVSLRIKRSYLSNSLL